MSWRQVVCHSRVDFQEPIAEAMETAGAVSITWQDAEDNPILEPKPGEMRLWDTLLITGLFEHDADLDSLLLTLEARKADWNIQDVQVEQVEDQAWERAWMENFHPMCFGKRLWIYPSWQEPPTDGSVQLLLDPGLAFGTGTHPTTALCLEWLDGQELDGQSVLDYGCGSGILAIAALKLGARHAVATDIDPQALQATLDNAERNSIPPSQLHVCLPESIPAQQYDIVMANILAGPLVELAPVLLAATRLGSRLVLSGILAEQLDFIRKTYSPYLKDVSIGQKEDWVRISGTVL